MIGSRGARRLATCGGTLWVLAVAPAASQQQGANAVESLGRVEFGVSCDASVTGEFDRAVALLHHMTYPAALAAFQAVSRADPECALAYWGAAMTLFQPLWPNRPTAADLRRGWELTQEARRRVQPGGREAMFVRAAEAFFDPDGEPDYWERIARWASATTDLWVAYPNDREARAFFALAHLASASLGDPATHHEEAAAVLATVLAEEPTHPGAVHYLIHANDFSGRERASLDVVQRYDQIAPSNAHALHMPTHIFVRLGAWDRVIEGNQDAAAAALEQRVGPAGEYVWDEFPHAIEYLVYARLQQGDDRAAAELTRQLNATPALQPTFKTAFHLASTAVRRVVEARDWVGASTLRRPVGPGLAWEQFPWPEALVWFARGLGATHIPGADSVLQESLEQLGRLAETPAARAEPVFAQQIEILRLEVSARAALRRGDREDALRLLGDAVALEARAPKHPVTPAPMLPALELLGDMHLEIQDAQAALDAYRRADAQNPGRLNTLLGLARAHAALGDAEAAAEAYRRLLAGAAASSSRGGIREARAYLERR